MSDLAAAQAPRFYWRVQDEATNEEITREAERLIEAAKNGMETDMAATWILAMIIREKHRAVSDWIQTERKLAEGRK